MKSLSCFGNKSQHLCNPSSLNKSSCRSLLVVANPLWVQVFYFISLSFLGFGILKALKPRTASFFSPKNLDLFLTSVSATTVSSMFTIEIEVFSTPQLIIMTILMFTGGEVFTSTVGLYFIRSRLKTMQDRIASVDRSPSSRNPDIIVDQIELRRVTNSDPENLRPEPTRTQVFQVQNEEFLGPLVGSTSENLRYSSVKYLNFVVLAYFLVVQVIGVVMVSLYLILVSSAKEVLKNKGLNMFTFSVFTVVSTFANCGFVPTNENMVVFSKNSGLLIMLIPQVLLGNTLFPPCLRFCIWVLGKCNYKTKECKYLLKNTEEVGYKHLLPGQHSVLLVATAFGFILIQVTLFCSMDWNSEALLGLNSYQKVIGVLFQSVNSRHAGESIVDLSIVSSAILVLFVVMMYLPPYTTFLPVKDDEQHSESSGRRRKGKGKVVENLILSQLSYLVIFIILVCITERKKLKEDPLNFNVLNIVVEVISAYGNVGFSTGYSCKRQLHPEANCKDKWFGFVGKWSNEGKIVLIVVMIFGRLKKFNMDGGKAWKLI